MHIGIINWSLFETKGGLERVACALAQAMLEKGHRVTIFYHEGRKNRPTPVYQVPPEISLCGLALDSARANPAKARTHLARAGLDVLVAMFAWESLLWFPWLLKGSGVPLIISEHNSPSLINSKWNTFERECCLKSADAVHVLLSGFAQEYPPEVRNRLHVIPNAYWQKDIQESRGTSRKTLLAVGRFDEPSKRFSTLIKAFAALKNQFPDWDLEICGSGTAEKDYTALCASLELGSRIRLPGQIEDITPHYAAADLFCIPSITEGFGMVTVEAQAAGLAAVGFADCPGTNEIIVHGENGLLAEERSPECLARHLATLMANADLRTRMGERGKAMLNRYAPDAVYAAWEKLLAETAENKNRTCIDSKAPFEATDATRLHELALQTSFGDTSPQGQELAELFQRELVSRAHPFDRSLYLTLHERLTKAGLPSPFSEQEIKGFHKKHKRFGCAGRKTPFSAVAHWLRRLRP